MKHHLPLKQYHYTVPATSLLANVEAEHQCWLTQAEQFLLQFDFDFENGTLQLTGHWAPIRLGCLNEPNPGSACERHEFLICTQMETTLPVCLDGPEEEALFLLGGCMAEDDFYTECTGFLVIEKSRFSASASWYTCSLYLYDVSNENFEISCKLPLYTVQFFN